ncbi:MAG: S8 family serine peptidase [Pseudomonadota bacterium]
MKTVSHRRRRPTWAVSLLALVCVCATAALPGAVAERGPTRKAQLRAPAEAEARVIVKFTAGSALMRALSADRPAAPPQHAQALSNRLGLSLVDGRPIGARAQVVMAAGISSQALAERLAAQSDVEYAVVDARKYALGVIPNDPLYAAQQGGATPAVGQWYLRAPTSSTIAGPGSVVSAINAEAAWGITTGSSSVVVAVLDTGVRLDHPDLVPKLRPGYDFVRADISNDGDGPDADPSDPGDHEAGYDSSWHGTQTAGLIGAATNNGIGMAGAGRDVMLLPIRVLGTGGGYDSDIQAAMLWAGGLTKLPTTDQFNQFPAKVLNLSLGSTGACSASYRDVVGQLNNAGVVVVAAAGNDGLAVGTPANCAGVIAVAGVRHAGTKVGYSDLGPEIALAAPAGNCVNESGACLYPVLTTSNSGTTTPVADAAGGSIYTGDGLDASLGTSFSAPLVSGTVGLMLSANPTLTPAQVKVALQSTARAFPTSGAPLASRVDGGPLLPVEACAAPSSGEQKYECYCTTTTCGAGLVDAGAATLAAATITAQITPLAPSVAVGASVTLDAGGSWPSAGASIATYQWAITEGATLARLTSSTSATAVVQAQAAGAVSVTLTLTDTAGSQSTRSVALTVTPAPPPQPSSGGGGALGFGGLLGLMAALIGVRAVMPRRRR